MKTWQTPSLTQFGDVASITLGAQDPLATTKCPGAGDDLAQSIADTNLPEGALCS